MHRSVLRSVARTAAIAVPALFTAPAFADFTGQPILGPLVPGIAVTGDLTGKSDDNDGFFSGDHIFDIWDGGDDVYSLIWAGGDMTVNLVSGPGDADLFIYRPSSLDESADYSAAGSFDSVSIPAAAAGTYYIVIDTTAGSEGPYTLTAIPAPGAAGVGLTVGLVTLCRRRR